MPPPPDSLSRFLALLDAALAEGTLVKLTLGKPRPTAPDSTLRNVFARPVTLKAGPQISLVYRHATRDVTKNLPPSEARADFTRLLAETFFDAHLFTGLLTAQLEQTPDGHARLRQKAASSPSAPPPSPTGHDHAKNHVLAADASWLRALGVTNEHGRPREGMAHKFRQIEKFAELLRDLLAEGGLRPARSSSAPLRIADMGAGKGYLTFALAALLRDEATVTGIERRADLVALGNRVAAESGLAASLRFVEGDIPVPGDGVAPAPLDVLIALHACDTATDDALAAGHAAGARLLVVSPCCQKELRATFSAPSVLADALRHGIFQERQAEFVTDALRAQLLECAGYRTKVFEFISTEHTAKNLLIAAHRVHAADDPAFAPRRARALERTRAFAAFYGVREQRLALHLGIDLAG
jgi:SAM-dependent methyltransferase